MIFRSIFLTLALLGASAALVMPAFGDTAPIYTTRNSDLALGGYDAVAYFTIGEPTEGSAAYTSSYQGAVFQFASQENLDLFQADPAKYAPQYGGYCAWAAARGKTAAGKPQHWAIVDGRLYLNYSRGIQRKWDADRAGFITKADAAWPTVVGSAGS
jgi:YHS domain-containing protein